MTIQVSWPTAVAGGLVRTPVGNTPLHHVCTLSSNHNIVNPLTLIVCSAIKCFLSYHEKVEDKQIKTLNVSGVAIGLNRSPQDTGRSICARSDMVC